MRIYVYGHDGSYIGGNVVVIAPNSAVALRLAKKALKDVKYTTVGLVSSHAVDEKKVVHLTTGDY